MEKTKKLLYEKIKSMSVKELLMLLKIIQEYHNAKRKHPSFTSLHQGYAVILEELDETWEVIKRKAGENSILSEIQAVGAVILRFMVDLL